MAIHPPGERFRYNATLARKEGGKREVTAMLSLTAMVDMFTVLVVFLLQSYNTTGAVIYIPKEVQLPKAAKIKELKPSVVVTISNKEVLIDRDSIITYDAVKAMDYAVIEPLLEKVKLALEKAKTDFEAKLQQRLKTVVQSAQGTPDPVKKEEEELNSWNKVTVQADKGIDFLTVKKVMLTVSEAGAGELNFAVMKDTEKKPEAASP